jgi:hypothetical protein
LFFGKKLINLEICLQNYSITPLYRLSIVSMAFEFVTETKKQQNSPVHTITRGASF